MGCIADRVWNAVFWDILWGGMKCTHKACPCVAKTWCPSMSDVDFRLICFHRASQPVRNRMFLAVNSRHLLQERWRPLWIDRRRHHSGRSRCLSICRLSQKNFCNDDNDVWMAVWVCGPCSLSASDLSWPLFETVLALCSLSLWTRHVLNGNYATWLLICCFGL